MYVANMPKGTNGLLMVTLTILVMVYFYTLFLIHSLDLKDATDTPPMDRRNWVLDVPNGRSRSLLAGNGEARQHLKVRAPKGPHVINEPIVSDNILDKCKELLHRKGYHINKEQRPVKEESLPNVTVGMRTTEKIVVKALNSILLRTDDPRTIQTQPWGSPPRECSVKYYGNLRSLPTVSIIICFCENEILADLLHTIHSTIQRTPDYLLKEFILLDDNTRKDDFKEILDVYLRVVFRDYDIKLVRSTGHQGLIRCRLHGAQLAKGDVIYFMDSHMEVQPGWLEPLLWEIKMNPKTMATSYLDWMEKDYNGTWSYKHGASSWKTYFDWKFAFGFQVTSMEAKSHDMTSPVVCPVTVGGVFAINRSFFFDIGGFDEGMIGWGGENLDLPIRVWLFGGRVVNVPCSHVGHMEKPGSRLYRISWQPEIQKNYKRVTEVWLGEYKRYFYHYNPSFKSIDPGNLTSRVQLSQRAPRNFSWILQNVYPELGLYDQDTFAWNGLRNNHYNTCLWASAPLTKPELRACDIQDTTHQGFFLNNIGELRFPVHIFMADGNHLVIKEYIGTYQTRGVTHWIHWPDGPLRVHRKDMCLDAVNNRTVVVSPCDNRTLTQNWSFHTYSDKLNTIIHSSPPRLQNSYLYYLYRLYWQAHPNDFP